MAIITPLKLGNRQLNRVSEAININRLKDKNYQFEIRKIANDLLHTLDHHQGVGIAAPQIGHLQRIIVIGFKSSERYPQEKPFSPTILINPEFQPATTVTAVGWEGCLSVPGLRGKVRRYTEITYQAYTLDGMLIRETAAGFKAKIIQHEIDHLNGILFPYKLDNPVEFGFEDQLAEQLKSPG